MQRKLVTLLSAALAWPAVSAQAGTGRLTFTPSNWIDTLSAFPRSDFSTVLPAIGDGGVFLSLALPKNYKKNSGVTVRMRLSAADAGCPVLIIPERVLRNRPGKPTELVDEASDGFSHKSPAYTVTPGAGVVFTKTFTLKPATGGSILNQKAGDGFVLSMLRKPGDPGDICPGDVAVHFIDVIYQTN